MARSLRPRHVAMIALGGVVGAGLFVGSSAAICAAGPAVVVSYALAGALAYAVMRMLGAMAMQRPGLGSFVAHVRATLGPRAGFVSGWLYWYFWMVAVGAETIAGAALLADWVALPVPVLGFGLIAFMTATNLVSVRSYGEFEYWFSLIKVAAIAAFILVAAAHLGWTREAAGLAGNGGVAPKGWLAALGAVPVVIFSLTGSEIASIAAAESDDPAGNVARAARSVALRIAAFYVLSVALIVAIVPWSSLEAGRSPFVAALVAIGVPGAATAMQVLILVAVLSCLNSGLYVTSRTLFELAEAGHAPRALVATGAGKVPMRAVLLGAAAGLAAALASMISPGGVFAVLLETSGAVILFVYGLIALAFLGRAGRGRWLGALTGIGIAGVFAAMAVLPGQRPQLLASAGSVAAAWLASVVLVRRVPARPVDARP